MSGWLGRASAALEDATTELVTAVVRMFVIAVVTAGSLSDQPFVDSHELFPVILGVAAVYAAIAFGLARAGRPLPITETSIIDMVFVALLMLASGGAFADVRFAFFLFPVVAAVTAGPRTTARWAGLAPAVYVIVAALHDSGDIPGQDATAATFSIYLAGIGAVSILIAELLRRRNERIETLAEASRTLAVRALEAEESERRRLAYGLHDEPIQQLLSAQLDLDRAARGDTEAAESARSAVKTVIGQLRETIFDLYPSSLEQLGLATALEQLAGRAADRSGAEIELEVAPEATGTLDGLLFTVGRELLRNAVEHSGAERITMTLDAVDGSAVLTVADDGEGIAPDRAAQALREGHLGLAASRERAEALGGSFELDSTPGRGTTARVTLPLGPPPGGGDGSG